MYFDCKELDYFAVVAPFDTFYAQDTTKEVRLIIQSPTSI